MKVILTIGYIQILLPDEKGIQTILTALSKGVACRDKSYAGHIELTREPLSIEFKTVPEGTCFVDEQKNEVVNPTALFKERPKIPSRPVLQLESRKIQ